MNIKIEQSDKLKYVIRFPDGYNNEDMLDLIRTYLILHITMLIQNILRRL